MFAFFRTADAEATAHAAQLLEEGKSYQIDKQWSVRVDRSIHDPASTHCHVQLKRRDVAVINQDGTPSHNSDLSQIPNWVRQRIRDKGLTESIVPLQTEADWIPAHFVIEAVAHEELMDAAIKLAPR